VQKAAVMDDPFVYTLPDTGSVTLATLSPPSWCTAAKVVTSLPAEDAPKPKPIFEITAEQLATGDNPDSHRSRLKCVLPSSNQILIPITLRRVRKLQQDNLTTLMNAELIREWWQIVLGFTDMKMRDPQVIVEQLRDVERCAPN
jgi:hypothetical protein